MCLPNYQIIKNRMNKYNPNIHHRKSIRLKGYDYTQAGLYFITICVKGRLCLFGNIVQMNQSVGADLRVCPEIRTNAEMILNDAGKMVEKWCDELENKFPDIRCHEMVIMPNHFHCIIENIGTVGADLRVCPNKTENVQSHGITPTADEQSSLGEHVGADLRVCPDTNNANAIPIEGEHVGADLRVCPDTNNANAIPIEGEHVGSPLHRVVQWFKTMTTNEYIRGVKNLRWQPFDGKLWQRNYYEHIIRNEQSYHTISEYIINNPAKWQDDKFYIE